ncbi:MAG: CHASE2 domain-containing protein [Synergistaceae bacterium]|jgi:serine phosphatase RsbU (regulator of sigma subunit)/CHASE2 domain-containing sensor protein|nr:CHASE2 domain-containing protein [Synergistaceae bacterium]
MDVLTKIRRWVAACKGVCASPDVLLRLAAGFAAVMAAAALYASSPLILTRLELSVYDMMLPLRAAENPSYAPVIIDIDERSLEAVGQWPWPRFLIADLAAALDRGGAAAIAFDALFSERDNSSPDEIAEYLRSEKNVSVTFEGLPDELSDYDKLMAEALENAPAVLAVFGSDEGNVETSGVPDAANVMERASKGAAPYEARLYRTSGGVFPLPEFRAVQMGTINVEPERDGIIRKASMVISIGGKIYPNLSLAALMTALGTKNLILGSGPDGLEYVRAGDFTIPVAPDGTLRVPYIGPARTYEYISAVDALRGNIPKDRLEGRIAFVGSSARGLADLHPTPYDPLCPGVENHAAVIDAVLTENWITEPLGAGMIQYAIILSVAFVSAVMFGFARPRVYVPLAAVLAGGIAGASAWCFSAGVYITPVYALVSEALSSVCLMFVRFLQEERGRIRVASRLALEMERRERAQADLNTARNIQASALTRVFPPFGVFGEMEAFAEMRPAKDVGGDFYDCFAIDDNRLAVLIADVSGKGVPAALFMMKAQSVIRNETFSAAGTSAGAILAAANGELCRGNDASMFVTVFMAIYDKKNGKLEFANAGHNPPVVARGRKARWLDSERNFVLGAFEGMDFPSQSVSFGEGDALVLYTDGVTESMNESGELFGDGRLIDLAERIFETDRPAREIVAAIDSEVASFAGNARQSDDVTVLVLKKTRKS